MTSINIFYRQRKCFPCVSLFLKLPKLVLLTGCFIQFKHDLNVRKILCIRTIFRCLCLITLRITFHLKVSTQKSYTTLSRSIKTIDSRIVVDDEKMAAGNQLLGVSTSATAAALSGDVVSSSTLPRSTPSPYYVPR